MNSTNRAWPVPEALGADPLELPEEGELAGDCIGLKTGRSAPCPLEDFRSVSSRPAPWPPAEPLSPAGTRAALWSAGKSADTSAEAGPNPGAMGEPSSLEEIGSDDASDGGVSGAVASGGALSSGGASGVSDGAGSSGASGDVSGGGLSVDVSGVVSAGGLSVDDSGGGLSVDVSGGLSVGVSTGGASPSTVSGGASDEAVSSLTTAPSADVPTSVPELVDSVPELVDSIASAGASTSPACPTPTKTPANMTLRRRTPKRPTCPGWMTVPDILLRQRFESRDRQNRTTTIWNGAAIPTRPPESLPGRG
jgi:hypothetical protein